MHHSCFKYSILTSDRACNHPTAVLLQHTSGQANVKPTHTERCWTDNSAECSAVFPLYLLARNLYPVIPVGHIISKIPISTAQPRLPILPSKRTKTLKASVFPNADSPPQYSSSISSSPPETSLAYQQTPRTSPIETPDFRQRHISLFPCQ